MKTIKKIFAVVIIAASVIPVFNGCRKGKEDPFLSIHTRNARLIGVWTLSKYDITDSTTTVAHHKANGSQGAYAETTVTNTTVSYDGTSKTTTTATNWSTTQGGLPSGYPTSSALTDNMTEAYTLEITIAKDGTYSWKKTWKTNPNSRTTSQTSSPAQTCPTGTSPTPFGGFLTCDGTYTYSFTNTYDKTDVGTGEWDWASTNKRKTEVVFKTGTFAGNYDILRLANKELKVDQNTSDNATSTDPDGTDTNTSKRMKWTFEQK